MASVIKVLDLWTRGEQWISFFFFFLTLTRLVTLSPAVFLCPSEAATDCAGEQPEDLICLGYECESLHCAGGAPATGAAGTDRPGAALQKGLGGANVARRSREGVILPCSAVLRPHLDTVSSFGSPSAVGTSGKPD